MEEQDKKKQQLYEKQREYWDNNLDIKNINKDQCDDSCKDFDFQAEKCFYLSPEQKYAYEQMGDLKGKRVLEIGAGLGVNALIMAEKGAEVYALDISSKRLKLLKSLAAKTGLTDKIHLCVMPAECLAFEDGMFDIVYTKSVLIHLELSKVFPEIKRVLKKDGLGVFIEPLKYHPIVNLYRMLLGPKEWKGLTRYFSTKSIGKWGGYFAEHKHKEFFIFSFLSFIWQFKYIDSVKFDASLKRWYPIDKMLLNIFPLLKHICWMSVLICRK